MSSQKNQRSFQSFVSSGQPWVWMNAGAVAISMIMVAGLLLLIAMRGLGHFWPKTVYEIEYDNGTRIVQIVGERVETEEVPRRRIIESGITIDSDEELIERSLIKVGIREVLGVDFMLTVAPNEKRVRVPKDVIVLERTQWGNFYGYLRAVEERDETVNVDDAAHVGRAGSPPAARDGTQRAYRAHREKIDRSGQFPA